MEPKIKKNKNLLKIVHFSISNNEIQKHIQLELTTLNNTVNMNGFRKGKIPLYILINKYGEKIHQIVLKKLIKNLFLNKIKEEKIHVAGTPTFILKKYERNKDFNFSVEFETYPKFILNIQQITIDIPKINITETDIQEIAHSILNKNVWIKVSRTIKLHDKVTITCINNAKNKENKCDIYNFQTIIGTNDIIPQIEKKLLKHKTNESFLINITFLKNHCEKKVAGKKCEIKVIINKVEELQKKLAKEKNKEISCLTAKELEKIKNILKNQSQIIIKRYIKSQIIKNLLKSNPIDVPSTLIKENFLLLQQKNKKLYKKNKKNIFKTTCQKNLILQSQKKVATAILIQKFIKENFLKPNLNAIKTLITQMATSQNHIEKLNWLYENNEHVRRYFNNIDLEEQVISKITQKTTKNFKEYNFCEAIKQFSNIKYSNIE
ncbi:MAG: trigger factor [Buchnera aphidicola (Nurudea yanoniella)]